MSDQASAGIEEEFEQVMSAEEVAARKFQNYGRATWGPWLFGGVMTASLVFMWWLVIYSHGVALH